jgi:hypothetical protein
MRPVIADVHSLHLSRMWCACARVCVASIYLCVISRLSGRKDVRLISTGVVFGVCGPCIDCRDGVGALCSCDGCYPTCDDGALHGLR